MRYDPGLQENGRKADEAEAAGPKLQQEVERLTEELKSAEEVGGFAFKNIDSTGLRGRISRMMVGDLTSTQKICHKLDFRCL